MNEAELRNRLADELEAKALFMAETAADLGVLELSGKITGTINGLKMAACLVRDNHPKEEVSGNDD